MLTRDNAAAPGLIITITNGNVAGMNVTLDKMSRLVVPKAVRDRFALKPGAELELTLEPDGIRLRPLIPSSPLTEENGILVCSS